MDYLDFSPQFNGNLYFSILIQKHVQALLEDEGAEITNMLLDKEGHFYVCGDCKMAEEVQQKLKEIIRQHGKLSATEVDDFILLMMVSILIICLIEPPVLSFKMNIRYSVSNCKNN